MRRKIVKNHGLIPLLFDEIFELKNWIKFPQKFTQINAKLPYVD